MTDNLVKSIKIISAFRLLLLLGLFFLLTRMEVSARNLYSAIALLTVIQLGLFLLYRAYKNHAQAETQIRLNGLFESNDRERDYYAELFDIKMSGFLTPEQDEIIESTLYLWSLQRLVEEHNKGHWLGDATCVYNARSPLIQCAVNPGGDCRQCAEYRRKR